VYASINFCNIIKKLALIITALSIVSLLSISPAVAAVNDWEFSPQEPVSGDILSIKGSASPEEDIDAFVTFEKTVPVSDGEFEYILEGVKIPEGMNNKFTVEATGAKKLNVRVKMVVWVTKSSEASGDTAVVSQSSVPSGTYQIKIDGDAGEGVSKVKLRITAFQGIKADSNGEFTYSYSTKSIPPGDFDIKVGGITKTVTIKSEENSGSTSDSSSDSSSIDTSSKGSTYSNSSFKDSSSEKSPSSSSISTNSSSADVESHVNLEDSGVIKEDGTSEVTNQDEDLAHKENKTQLSGKSTQTSESSGHSTDKLYLLAGMGAGLLILIIYSRKK